MAVDHDFQSAAAACNAEMTRLCFCQAQTSQDRTFVRSCAYLLMFSLTVLACHQVISCPLSQDLGIHRTIISIQPSPKHRPQNQPCQASQPQIPKFSLPLPLPSPLHISRFNIYPTKNMGASLRRLAEGYSGRAVMLPLWISFRSRPP